MKKFFSLKHLKELRIILIIEFIITCLVLIIGNQQGLKMNFSFNAMLASLICYSLATIIDPKGYFNFFTLLAISIFGYGVWWFIFLLLPI